MAGMMTRLDRKKALSAKLDDLIEFSAVSELLEKLGKSGSEAPTGLKGYLGSINPPAKAAGVTQGIASGPSAAQTGLDKVAAARGWGTRGVATPVGGSTTASYLGKFNAPVAGSSANAAQKVAQAAGQNVAATGGKPASVGRRAITSGLGVVTGGAVGGAVLTPDWALKQKQELSAWLDDIIEFADPRPRNPLGEFTNQEGGPDANAMATVYKMPQAHPQHEGPGIPKLAGAALIGGALGQVGGNIGKEGWAGMAKLVKHLSRKAKLK